MRSPEQKQGLISAYQKKSASPHLFHPFSLLDITDNIDIRIWYGHVICRERRIDLASTKGSEINSRLQNRRHVKSCVNEGVVTCCALEWKKSSLDQGDWQHFYFSGKKWMF